MLLYGTMNQTEKGRLWRAVNPTPGTGIATPSGTGFNNASATFFIGNTSLPDASGRTLILEYVKLICSTNTLVGATSAQAAVLIDSQLRGQTADLNTSKAPADTDALSTASTAALVRVLATGLAAISANARVITKAAVKVQAAPVVTVGDEIIFIFNEDLQGLGALSGAPAARYVVPGGLVSIDPQHCLSIHLWYPNGSSGGPSYEYEASWYEK